MTSLNCTISLGHWIMKIGNIIGSNDNWFFNCKILRNHPRPVHHQHKSHFIIIRQINLILLNVVYWNFTKKFTWAGNRRAIEIDVIVNLYLINALISALMWIEITLAFDCESLLRVWSSRRYAWCRWWVETICLCNEMAQLMNV